MAVFSLLDVRVARVWHLFRECLAFLGKLALRVRLLYLLIEETEVEEKIIYFVRIAAVLPFNVLSICVVDSLYAGKALLPKFLITPELRLLRGNRELPGDTSNAE